MIRLDRDRGGRRQQWHMLAPSEAAFEAQDVFDEAASEETGATGIDAPAAIDVDLTFLDLIPFPHCLIAVMEGGVAAAEIGVALAQRCIRQCICDGDRIDEAYRLPQRIGISGNGKSFAIA